MAITTPALHNIETCFMPLSALRHADQALDITGTDPIYALTDAEINRQHRAIAIGWLASLPDYARSCLYRNPAQFEYVKHLDHEKGEN